MSDLQHWEGIIKEKRKKTPFRQFLREIVSRYPFVLHKRDGLITRFPKSERVKNITDKALYEANRDILTDKGIDYNFSLTFFENFKKLSDSIDYFNLFSFASENCNYGDNIYHSKNSYLSNGVIHECENVLYSFYTKQNCKNIFNSCMVWDTCENVYFASGILQSYNIFYSKYIYNSSNIWFSSNLTGCNECLLCDSLENVSYCIENKSYEKDEYMKRKKQIFASKNRFFEYYKYLNPVGKGFGNTNVTGNFSLFCENVENSFYSYRVKNGRNIILMGSKNGNEDFYDCFGGGSPKGNNYYGCVYIGTYLENAYLSMIIDGGANVYYGYDLAFCSFCLGCVGLKNKSYCILNKQYTKEEWYELADKIFQQMEREGILGDFFPGELNPFYFNDTAAYLIDDSFTKEEVERDGYMWRDSEIKVDIPEGAEIVKTSELNTFQGFDENGVWTLNPEILKKVIVDEKGNSYRIVKMEYDFLVKYGLPLPEIHWLDRIKMGFRF